MISLIVHAVLGVATIWFIVASNKHIFRQPVDGPKVTVLELIFYAAGIIGTALGWYFNIRFVNEYAPPGGHNPIWGPGSWTEFIVLGYDNPAASSASQDYTIMSVILFPIYSILDGRRRGIARPWTYCLLILFTSSAFAWAFYLVTVERQRRLAKSANTAALAEA